MKAALLIVLSLSALAFAGPAFNKNNQIESQDLYNNNKQQQNTRDFSSTGITATGPIVDVLKQWCFSSQMSAQELTASFKKLVGVVKSNPIDQATEQAVMSERICSTIDMQKEQKQQEQVDVKAHELIKDIYMDALIACKSRECTKQLLKIIQQQSDKVDTIRASYYMTRLAVTEKDQIKSIDDIKQLVESFVQERTDSSSSELVERQKVLAITSMVGKYCQQKPTDSQAKQLAQEVAKTIVERYVRPVSQQEIEQYQQQQEQQVSEQLVKKIAKRNVALKALSNLPGHMLKEMPEVEQQLMQISQNKQELVISRQSALECLEQNDKAQQLLKQITFDQEEPIEVRVAAYRALMTVAYSVDSQKDDQQKQQVASQIIDELIKHCERNQQQDDQFVLYVISHLDNIRSSQQPEHQAIKECIVKNKQHYMQIQVLCKKLKQQLSDMRRSSRNYKLEQEFNQIESGLVLEGDIIYESKQQQQLNKRSQEQVQILPKLIRVNMSMPVMGETVNVVEVTLRQNQMEEEILSTLKLVQDTKISSSSVSKVVDSFKSSVEKQQQQQSNNKQQGFTEADLTIKVDGCTIVYLTVDDFKTTTTTTNSMHHQTRQTRSVTSSSLVEDVIEYLKRSPVSFNRGINFSLNERLAKLLDVEANLLAGLRFESRAQGHSSDDFEIVARVEPRFNFEAIVGPAKMSSKKLLQRVSTKTAVGLRLRYKRDQLVDIKVDLPMKTMELFTVESQVVERTSNGNSYNYLPESIYGQEDIYTIASNQYQQEKYLTKRSIFETNESSLKKLLKGKTVKHTLETPEAFQRATGLRGMLRFVAAPKDMSFIASCLVDKYEPSMEGFRVLLQKSPASKTYTVQVSTPGSRVDRQMQINLVKQFNSQRTIIKSEIQVNTKYQASFMTEIVHDGRQYSVKSELVSRSPNSQWRHFADAGLLIQGASKSPSGRLAQVAYKPYVQIESTSMKRPIQLQGTIAYMQSPKSVISYELKCPTSGDYVQGKLIVDQRDVQSVYRNMQKQQQQQRNTYRLRRSMQSPLELVLSKDLTLTSEFVAKVDQHAVKVHNMVDWDAQKIALKADSSVQHKNLRKSSTNQITANLKLDAEQQVLVVERKSPEDQRKEFRALVNSEWRAPSGHQMMVEVRKNERSQSMVVYKHNVNINKIAPKQYETQMEIELVDTERQINEKFSAHSRISNERKQKSFQLDLTNQKRQQSAKFSFDFESLSQHQLQAFVQTASFVHKCELRQNQRQFVLSSRTDKHSQTVAKLLVDLNKIQPSKDCKVVFEFPTEQLSFAADLKLASGQRSSVAVQTPRFVSQGEFSFETIARPFLSSGSWFSPKKSTNLRFRNHLKDLQSKEAYWVDSALNAANWDKESSYFRMESPIYRTDVEYDPRDQTAKFGTFARSKRSISGPTSSFDDIDSSIYSTKNSALDNFFQSHQTIGELAKQLNNQVGQPNKLWMLRAIMSSPFARDQLKQQARRALLQYVDREQLHKHSFEFQPNDNSFNFDFNRSPNTEYTGSRATFEPLRFKGDWSSQRPVSMSLESEFLSANIDAKPFAGADDDDNNEDAYARVSALSRHPRSPFKSHDSEWRYKKDQGHKAWVKHVDAKGKRHELRAQSERDPKKWAKIEMESEKHGKANWEHKWRKQAEKRSASNKDQEEEEIYANKVQFRAEGPAHKQWMHETSFEWDEPSKMIQDGRRYRRSILGDSDTTGATDPSSVRSLLARYSPAEYLKHTSARLSSSQYAMRPITGQTQQPLYKIDLDYKPQMNSARLDVHMPEDLLHSSSVELKPLERLYKVQSKLFNRRNQNSIYDFSASTKPYVSGLATADQEPVFVHSDHPMLERPIEQSSLLYQLFKQPMKLDYSDKYGRVASIDYDQLPISSNKYQGLRQKRAAIHYKDSQNDFEHSSSYDFYPETFLGRMNKQHQDQDNMMSRRQTMVDDVVIKTHTKYGPLVVRADTSDVDNMQCELESPVVNVKLTAESGANMRKLIKFHLDNKSQRVQLSKLLRQAPETIKNMEVVQKVVRKIDSNRFEHDTELLVSIVDKIFKIKSSNKLNSRPIVVIDGEWNEQQGKAFAKINGERVNGQCVIDLAHKQAELVIDATNKHGEPIKHQTRLTRTSENFYTLDSTTYIKSRPVFKLQGKVSSMIFEEPLHVLTSHRSGRFSSTNDSDKHISTFEAVVYEPKQYQITGMFDCNKKEGRIVSKSLDENKVQETFVRYDENTETIVVDSRLSSGYQGETYATKAKVNLPGLFTAEKCHYSSNKCSSEVVYEDKSGQWVAKYQPGEYVLVSSPRTGKQMIKLNY